MTTRKAQVRGDEPGDREELMRLLWKAARRGNVPAMRILLHDMDRQGIPQEGMQEERSVIDELASRRAKRTG